MDKLKSFDSFNKVYESLTLFKDMEIGDEYKMFGDDKENKPMILKKTGDSEAQIVEVGSVKGVKKGEYQYPSSNGMYELINKK